MSNKHVRSILSLLLALCLCLGMLTTALAAQGIDYYDPAERWISSGNRTDELDSNAIVSRETFHCCDCDKETVFTVYRTPEYSRDGASALSRNVLYSDGTTVDEQSKGYILDGTPGVDATYTGYHWSKAVCETCGALNSNMGAYAHNYHKSVYRLNDCAAAFMQDLEETVTYEPADSQRHTKTIQGGEYCVFCLGTNKTSASTLERHHLTGDVTAEAGNHRFKETQRCADCGYIHNGNLAAKAVVSNYYGVADGKPHTLTVADLSDAGVSTAIRYGTTADACNLTSAPNYTEAGEYTVYYEITYTYGGQSMTENGVAYVQLHPQEPTEPPADLLGCTDHKYSLVSTVPATCTSLGYNRYLCTVCGATENWDYTAALGHNWQDMTIREASCGVPGKVAHICTRCGQVSTVETPAGEHAYTLFSVPATCTSSGYEAEECAICGERHILNVLDHTAHQYIATTTPATCTTGGRTTYRCTFCGDSYTDANTEPLGHAWDLGTVITAPTCTADGVKEYRCQRCDVTTLEAIPATGHTPKSSNACGQLDTCAVCGAVLDSDSATLSGAIHNYIATTTPATCTTGGRTTYRCTHCGDSYTDAYTEPLGHTWDLGTVITPATCTTDGVKEYRCARCDVTTLEAIPATGHTWHLGTVVTVPTCTAEGVKEYRCVKCGATTPEAIPATGHTPKSSNVCGQPDTCAVCGAVLGSDAATLHGSIHNYIADTTTATCTTGGRTTYRCTHCGDSYTDAYTEPLGHSWDLGTVITPATCTTDGVMEHHCTRCSATTLEAIPATGHNYDETVTPATCQTEGTITRRCKNCGDSETVSYMAALGHTWDSGTAVTVSNCTGDGVTEYHCTRCDATYLAASSAAGHTPGPAATCTQAQVCTVCGVVLAGPTGHAYEKTVIPPTCLEGGKTVFACTSCGSVYEIDPTQPLGHDWDAGTPVTTATCTGEGVMEHKCTRCDATYLEAQSAAGHTPGADATCTQPQVCADCGAVLKKPLGHSYTDAVTKATCAAMGYTTYTCKTCGDSYKDSYTPALEHKPGEWIVDREATTYREGQRHKTCTLCGKTVETETIPKLDTTGVTDAKGQAKVGGYLVTLRDTDSKAPISRAVVSLDDNALYVTLPDGRALVYTNQTTVTVQRVKDSSYVRGMSVTVTDKDGATETARTDRYGQATLPSQPEGQRHAAYIVGLPDGSMAPSGTMTRAEAAAIFARLLAGQDNMRVAPTATRFSDIPANAWYAGYVRYLDLRGVVNGCPGGVFKPDTPITRSEFTVMAARFYAAMGGEATAQREDGDLAFWDVAGDYWASAYIWQAAEQGWVLGNSGAFRGEDRITRAEAVTLVNRLLGREADQSYIDSHPRALRYFTDLSRGHWAYYDIMEAANGHTASVDAKGKEIWEK